MHWICIQLCASGFRNVLVLYIPRTWDEWSLLNPATNSFSQQIHSMRGPKNWSIAAQRLFQRLLSCHWCCLLANHHLPCQDLIRNHEQSSEISSWCLIFRKCSEYPMAAIREHSREMTRNQGSMNWMFDPEQAMMHPHRGAYKFQCCKLSQNTDSRHTVLSFELYITFGLPG